MLPRFRRVGRVDAEALLECLVVVERDGLEFAPVTGHAPFALFRFDDGVTLDGAGKAEMVDQAVELGDVGLRRRVLILAAAVLDELARRPDFRGFEFDLTGASANQIVAAELVVLAREEAAFVDRFLTEVMIGLIRAVRHQRLEDFRGDRPLELAPVFEVRRETRHDEHEADEHQREHLEGNQQLGPPIEHELRRGRRVVVRHQRRLQQAGDEEQHQGNRQRR